MRSLALVLLLLVAVTGCGHRSTYVRETAAPGEIVWAYDDGLVVTKDGQALARPHAWIGLTDAVGCVEEARTYAETAELNGTIGTVLSYGGLAALLLSPAIGIATGIGVAASHTAATGGRSSGAPTGILAGLATTGLLFVGGYGASIAGDVMVIQAFPMGLDAVNVYNDHFEERPACQR